MSYGVVRVQKMTAGSVKGIEIHDRREKDGISHTNKDIDWSRTSQNYDLCADKHLSFTKAVKDRISSLELPRAVRKDAVVMSQVLVTSGKEFFDGLTAEQQKQFFKDSYDFLAERYGSQNVISATVHMDETTPHMHFNFVPVTADGRLSAKSVLTRKSLIEQQTAFFEKVGKKYGLERGLQGGQKKHLEIAELKALTALESVSKAEAEAQAIKEGIAPLKAEFEARRAYVTECDKASDVATAMPDYAKVSKSLFGKQSVTVPLEKWKEKHVSANEKAFLKKSSTEFERYISDFTRSNSYKHMLELTDQNKALAQQVDELKFSNKLLQEKFDRFDARLDKVLDRLPADAHDRFVAEWNNAISSRKKNQNRGYHER